MVNVCAFEVPPPGVGFTTVTCAVPLVATSAAGTTAVSCVEETKVVVRAEPFQFTFDVEMKFVPFTVRVNWALPAVVELGLIEVVVGAGLSIVNVCAFDVPPGPEPLGGFTTVTCAVPLVATSAAGTTAVSCVEETKVVVRAEPFQFTFDVEMKPVPFTVRVNWALPAVVELGLIPLVVGPAARALPAATNRKITGKIRFIS
jgi:antibiotic biosynthesis monooxygenase (ABM) superfamily enzyme